MVMQVPTVAEAEAECTTLHPVVAVTEVMLVLVVEVVEETRLLATQVLEVMVHQELQTSLLYHQCLFMQVCLVDKVVEAEEEEVLTRVVVPPVAPAQKVLVLLEYLPSNLAKVMVLAVLELMVLTV